MARQMPAAHMTTPWATNPWMPELSKALGSQTTLRAPQARVAAAATPTAQRAGTTGREAREAGDRDNGAHEGREPRVAGDPHDGRERPEGQRDGGKDLDAAQ